LRRRRGLGAGGRRRAGLSSSLPPASPSRATRPTPSPPPHPRSKYFWSCSKAFNGSLTGYLVPTGWDPVGGTPAAGDSTPINPGIYNWVQEGVSYPIMAVLSKPADRHLVFAIRGSNTGYDWRQSERAPAGRRLGCGAAVLLVACRRRALRAPLPRAGTRRAARRAQAAHLHKHLRPSPACHPPPSPGLYYSLTPEFKFPGEPFEGNQFDGATHEGYTKMFAQLWPDVQAVLKAQVVQADKKTAVKHVTFGGHSMGGVMVTMLSFAVSARRALWQ
jgi:hypothetical protein